MSASNGIDARLEDEAIAWLARVEADAATAKDWIALTAWMEASDAHVGAFARAEALSAEIRDHSAELAVALPRPTGEVIALKPAPRRAVGWASWVGLAAAAAVVAIAVVSAPEVRRAYQGAPVTYRTAVGETREIALSDGSHVRLDGASALTVRMGWRTRRIDLGQAQASFDVAKDPHRPFVVNVGDQQVRVVGTEFNILHEGQEVVVTVRRGVVDVRQPRLAPDRVARLASGEELRHVEGAQVSQQQRVEPDAAFAWASGHLICHDEPLSRIVLELNRRYAVPIHVTAAAGAKRFSGVLELGDQTRLVETLADYLSLTVRRTQRDIALS